MAKPKIACSGPIGDIAIDILNPYGEIVVAKDSSEAALLSIMAGAIGLVLRGDGIGSGRVTEVPLLQPVWQQNLVSFEHLDLP